MRPAPLPRPWHAEETALGLIVFLPQIRCGDGKIFCERALPTRAPTLAPAILPYISHPCFSIQAQSAPPLLQSWLLSPVLLRRNQMPTREKRSGASKRKVPRRHHQHHHHNQFQRERRRRRRSLRVLLGNRRRHLLLQDGKPYLVGVVRFIPPKQTNAQIPGTLPPMFDFSR